MNGSTSALPDRRVLGAVILAVALAACTSDRKASAPPSTSGAPDNTGAAKALAVSSGAADSGSTPVWATTSVKPLGQPAVRRGVAAVYSASGGKLWLVGVSVRDGRERWRRAASPGYVVTGIGVIPGGFGDWFTYLRPDPSAVLATRLVVADPADGKDVYVSQPMRFTARPGPCDDDDRALCTTASTTGVGATRWRWSQALRVLSPDVGSGAPAGSRDIGSEGLTDLGVRDPEYLAAYDGAKQLWRRDASSLLGPGYSSDNGWTWHFDRTRKQWVGYIGPQVTRTASASTVNLEDMATVALDRSTGRTRWVDRGSIVYCFDATDTPTDAAAARAMASTPVPDPSDHADRVPVRCRATGRLTFHRGGEPSLSPDAQVSLEGFNRDTGKRTWTAQVDFGLALFGFGAKPLALLGRHDIVASRDGKPVRVDLTTGKVSAANPQAAAWCSDDQVKFEYAEADEFPEPIGPKTERLGGSLAATCTVSGATSSEAPQGPIPNRIGVAGDGMLLVATSEGLRAYRPS